MEANLRRRKVQRVVKVQHQILMRAKLDLAALELQAGKLKVAQEALIHTMNEQSPFHGFFAESMSKRLQKLSHEAAQVESAKVTQIQAILEQAKRLKRAEKVAEELNEECRRNEERKNLLLVIESIFVSADASFQ